MATLLLQSAGSALGRAIGGPAGAALGRTAGSLLGALVNDRLSGAARVVEGPRLTTLATLASTEGAPVPRVYGRARIGGQMIWSTRLIETSTSTRSGSNGGKSTGSGTRTTNYNYAANFAIGLCEGPIAFVRRIWADGKELDRETFTARLHRGTQDQAPDPLIVAKEGAGSAPAYRELAYMVFENFSLAAFGNRIPQLSFEVVRPLDGLCDMIRAVDLIPGASEYAYGVQAFVQNSSGVTTSENRHQLFGASDWSASLDALQALCPNLKHVALVASWFGDDMRAGHCTIAPRVESRQKSISGAAWASAGLTRATAPLVSQIEGRPAYGGTPSDDILRAAIRDLRARGLKVLFYPFVMMDVPFGNRLPDPASGEMWQKAYGWRGEIVPAAADGTAGVGQEIAHFFASYRAFIFHYARLCGEAGGVESFLLGSELCGLTHASDPQGDFPAVQALADLAVAVKAVLGAATKVSYAADWTEYGALVRDNGASVRFPLDRLWASPAIDFIGIDAYFPLSDWRATPGHCDDSVARSIYDRDYLSSRVAGGEGFDFYYADEAARLAQQRSPITDGACGKPWVFRAKDLVNWWSQRHFERTQGIEALAPTAWVGCSKPIWFIETGCPAIDLGANAPNVFPDARKETSELPPFSSGARDDLMQIRALEAFIAHFNEPAANPRSPLYGGAMVDPDRIYLWAYDARPFPAFPMLAGTWSDAGDWDTGHWLNGRLESAPLDRLVAAILQDQLGETIELPPLDAIVEGYVIDRPLSVRAALEPLTSFFAFDAVISGGKIGFQQRRDGAPLHVTQDDIVPDRNGALVSLTRAEDSELPHELGLVFSEAEWDYRPASVFSRRLEGATRRSAQGEVALVTHAAAAQRAADIWLQDLWVARESARVSLRPGLAGFEAGDLVVLPCATGERLFRITRLTDGAARTLECRAVNLAIHDHRPRKMERRGVSAPRLPGPPQIEILDLALARSDSPALQYLAAFADPWPGSLALWHSRSGDSFDFSATIERPAILGETLDPVQPGPVGRIDRATVFRVVMRGGFLSSVSEADMLAGRNQLALRGTDGHWEILGFAQATLVGEQTWALSHLLRGQGGEEALAGRLTPAGARVVMLDDALIALASEGEDLGLSRIYRIGPSARDHADSAFVQIEATAGGLALKPFAPVRAQARRGSAGIVISFLRRGRRNADGWEALDIPLGEASEAYLVEILDGGILKRTLTASQTSVLYASNQELSDFGRPMTSLALRIVQISARVGRGFPLEAQVPIL